MHCEVHLCDKDKEVCSNDDVSKLRIINRPKIEVNQVPIWVANLKFNPWNIRLWLSPNQEFFVEKNDEEILAVFKMKLPVLLHWPFKNDF